VFFAHGETFRDFFGALTGRINVAQYSAQTGAAIGEYATQLQHFVSAILGVGIHS
jgi:hypothetical protein